MHPSVLTKLFKIEPATASLSVNGNLVSLGEDGVGSVECEVGKMYNYTIAASGYETIEDAFMISPEDETVEPINITLERKLALVRIQTNVDNVEVTGTKTDCTLPPQDTPTEDTTDEESPKTGVISPYLILGSVVVISTVSIAVSKKKKFI